LNPKEREYLRTELSIIRHLKHPNIVEVYDICEDREKVYIVMEHVRGGDLLDCIKE
jgi:serine/threonine protein kinase